MANKDLTRAIEDVTKWQALSLDVLFNIIDQD